jgi:hypothetical protein
MTPLEKRLEVLERVGAAHASHSVNDVFAGALSRLINALVTALPDSYPSGIPSNTKEFFDKSITFEKSILALDGRIAAEVVTEDDRAVLSQLSADDLATAELTEFDVIAVLASVIRSV